MTATARDRRDRLRAMLANLKMPGALEAVDGVLAPNTPDGHHRENIRSARDVLPRSVQFSVATNVRFSVAIDRSPARRKAERPCFQCSGPV